MQLDDLGRPDWAEGVKIYDQALPLIHICIKSKAKQLGHILLL